MDDFSFENKFCQHFKYLRENAEVFVSFNIARCQFILNEKINISLYYNDKIDVENEKSRLDKFAVKCKLNERGWQITCEITTYVSDFHYGSAFFSTENFLTLLLSSIDDRLTRLLHVATLPTMRIDDKIDDDNDNIQNSP